MTEVVLEGSRDSAAQMRRATYPQGVVPNWGLVAVLLVAVGLAVLALYLFSPDWFHLQRLLPVGLGSPLRADYSADPFALAQPPVDARIIAEALADQQESAQDAPPGQLATLIAPLNSPVPTTTPVAGGTPGAIPTAAPTGGVQPSAAPPTRTPAGTATAAATRTPPASVTPTASATATSPATWLPTRTATPDIYRPSPTSGTIHTPTGLPATATAAPTIPPPATATSVPTATATPVVPTAVPATATPVVTATPVATATLRPPPTATRDPYPPPPYP